MYNYNLLQLSAVLIDVKRYKVRCIPSVYTYVFHRFDSWIFDAERDKSLTFKPIQMLILATTDADIKTVGKYWLYRKLWRKMPILVARSSVIDVCGAGDDLLASKTSKTSKTVCMYSFHAANYVYDGIDGLLISLLLSSPYNNKQEGLIIIHIVHILLVYLRVFR